MKKKLTKLEKQLLDIVTIFVFYGDHNEKCAKNWHHNPNLKCTCRIGKGLINGRILVNKYGGTSFHQNEVDKEWIKE